MKKHNKFVVGYEDLLGIQLKWFQIFFLFFDFKVRKERKRFKQFMKMYHSTRK